MIPLNVEDTLYAKLREIWETDGAWSEAIDEDNRTWFNNDDINRRNPNKLDTTDNDFPRSILRATSGSSGMWTDNQTFGTFSPEGPCSILEKQTVIFRLRLVSERLGFDEDSNLRQLSINALRKAGPALGLSWVTGVRVRWATTETDVDAADGTMRFQTDIAIMIECEIDSDTLEGT